MDTFIEHGNIRRIISHLRYRRKERPGSKPHSFWITDWSPHSFWKPVVPLFNTSYHHLSSARRPGRTQHTRPHITTIIYIRLPSTVISTHDTLKVHDSRLSEGRARCSYSSFRNLRSLLVGLYLGPLATVNKISLAPWLSVWLSSWYDDIGASSRKLSAMPILGL